MKKKVLFGLVIVFGIFLISIGIVMAMRNNSRALQKPEVDTPLHIANKYPPLEPPQEATLAASPVPSPTPLSFADMNAQFGPCVVAPTLMYHHIQALDVAKAEGHASLTVDTQIFRKHMQYLKDKGYSVMGLTDLIAFFDQGTTLPKKSVFLTFDDGYDDFGTDAVPVLNEFGFKSTLFVPTGLINNPGYVTWGTMSGFNSNVLLANHTWSHHSMGSAADVDTKEIATADTQLTEHHMNSPKTFAYPYGTWSAAASKILQDKGYQIAFTTKHGSTLCKKQRLALPRIRVGNSALSSYGL